MVNLFKQQAPNISPKCMYQLTNTPCSAIGEVKRTRGNLAIISCCQLFHELVFLVFLLNAIKRPHKLLRNLLEGK